MIVKKLIQVFISLILFSETICMTSSSALFAAEPKYCADEYDGTAYQSTNTETVTYTRKEDIEYNIPAGLPQYSDTSGLENICAVIAGTTIMGFYDRLHNNLIPDFTSARVIRDKVIYTNNSPKIQAVINTLYQSMGSSANGTTVAGFKNGLTSYVNQHGSTINYSNAGSNFSIIKNHVDNLNLVALFMDERFNFIPYGGIMTSGTTDTITKELYSGYHVSTVYGYRTISYFENDTLIKTKQFFKVGTGHPSSPLAYVENDNTVVIGAALCVTIC